MPIYTQVMKFFKGKIIHINNWILLILFSICIYQSVIIINNYAWLFASRVWRNRTLDAYDRSAMFLLGKTGADFMKFIASNTPIDKPVIVVERSPYFESQNILQYFLLPRPIVSCDCDLLGGKCNPCLQSPENYVPATQNFPPPEGMGTDKKLVPFESPTGKDYAYYLGIYVPNEVNQQSLNKLDTWNSLIFIKTLSIDLIVLICLGFLGYLTINLIFPGINSIDSLSLSIPAGIAVLTWFIFLASWVGISITFINILLIYSMIILSVLVFSRLINKQPVISIKLPVPAGFLDKFRHLDFLSIVSIIGILAISALAVLISVGRSYSIYDDISIWSLKGYGIAYAKTIFAGYLLGGHGLAYPLSLPLSIAIFKLTSGDMLPGSKLLFPIYTFALLWGCFRFLRRRGVNNRIAYLSMFLLITIPTFFYYTTYGYANIPFTACLVLGVLWGIEGLLDGNNRELLLSGFLIGFAGWIRPEGILFGALLIAILLVWQLFTNRKDFWQSWYWFLPGLFIPGIWLIFAHNYIDGDQAGGALRSFANRVLSGQYSFAPIILTVRYGIDSFLNPKNWGLILPVFIFLLILILLLKIQKPNRAVWPLFLVTLASFIIPLVLFLVESANENDFITFLTYSFDRAYLPAITLSVLLAFTAMFSKIKLMESKPTENNGEKAGL